MTTEEAKRIIDGLRRWGRWRKLPESDVALLRSQIEAHESVSFMLGIMLMGALTMHGGLSWWDLWFLGGFAFVGYCRWEMVRYRRALRLFETSGPQRIEDVKQVEDVAEPINSVARILTCLGVLSFVISLVFLAVYFVRNFFR